MTNVVKIQRKDNRIIQDCQVYIGRKINQGGWNLDTSIWHNPFSITQCDNDRELCLSKFEKYLLWNNVLIQRLKELENKTLGCWCGPDNCHGDILIKYVNQPPQLAICFWKPNEHLYGCFSNYWSSKIIVNGIEYQSVEHFYQSEKFIDKEYKHLVRSAKTAHQSKILACQKIVFRLNDNPGVMNPIIKHHLERGVKLRPNWDTINIMKVGLLAKFKQNETFRNTLISTGSKQIVEISPFDSYWGVGKFGTGQNQLGVLLMQIRDSNL